ncbi:MAG TPA: NAD(P)/FAD-dependent oxidoreductase [Polyangiaceae bacterium]|nr:NAD(P)/FAD-dependent oxidoreductase [Polyangiaceae bacterium]
MGLHVLIVGGGLGGLCLAQGLRKDGVSVAVYEREASPATAQGYRIHIDQTGSRALHTCLSPALWDAFVATAGQPCAGFGFLTDQMRELLFIEQRRIEHKAAGAPFDPVTSEHPVSRVALRQVLLGGLGDVVHFGKELRRYEATQESVTAYFGDGTSAGGDVLVGADGVGSRVRQQYLPHATVVDTGIAAVGGKLPLDALSRRWLPEAFATRLNSVLPPSGCGMFIAQYVQKPERRRFEKGGGGLDLGLHVDDLQDHVFWAFIAKRSKYELDADLRDVDGALLQTTVLTLIDSWHPDLVRLVADSDPRTVAAIRVQSSEPVQPWKTTRVVPLGDAIHAMTPFQGLGGNTAFRDAALLHRRLVEANRGENGLLAAIEAYEKAMLRYSFDAVRLSRKIGELAVSDDGFGRAMFKTVLRVVDGVPPLKQKIFGARPASE